MTRIKKLDTRILTAADVENDFGWRSTYTMFDDKFPYRTIVELGASEELWELREQAKQIVNRRMFRDSYRDVCDPEQFAEVLARLMH